MNQAFLVYNQRLSHFFVLIAGLYIALCLVLNKYLFKVRKSGIFHSYNKGIAGLYIGLRLVLNKYLFKVKKGDILYGYNEGIAVRSTAVCLLLFFSSLLSFFNLS